MSEALVRVLTKHSEVDGILIHGGTNQCRVEASPPAPLHEERGKNLKPWFESSRNIRR